MSGPRYGGTPQRQNDLSQWQQAPREEPKVEQTPPPAPPQQPQQPQAVYPNNIRVLPPVAPRPSYKWLLWLAGGMALAFFILYLLSEGEKEEVREQRREAEPRGRSRRDDYDDDDDQESEPPRRRESSSRGRDDRDRREYRTRRDDGERVNPLNVLPVVITPPTQHNAGQGSGGTNS